MTGRTGRLVRGQDGSVVHELRGRGDADLDRVNVGECKRFMDGEKLGEPGSVRRISGAAHWVLLRRAQRSFLWIAGGQSLAWLASWKGAAAAEGC